MIRWCTVPEIWCTMDGQTDRLKKWYIEVGTPPKNKKIQNLENKIKVLGTKLYNNENIGMTTGTGLNKT